ncbi:DENN domain-containing protein 3-like isoform X2 [Betta splendens]|uniref:DENN domain-containing protein 3-like isoform X2 n=1 Tax=Betta splendens TaxID=158456 RepID=A0A9W2XC36_BETSP|nr:DENN domain-containing protein 3-like isoform X2 [Betta splendens]
MTDYLPPTLLEACIIVGASADKLHEVFSSCTGHITENSTVSNKYRADLCLPTQAVNPGGTPRQLEPEVLHVLAPPFGNRPQSESESRQRLKKKRSILRRKRDSPAAAASPPGQGSAVEEKGAGEDVSVPSSINLMAIPQLCFPDGLQVTNEQRDEQFHFLVFTDVFGNKAHGVVMQCSRPILEGTYFSHNGAGSKLPKLFSAYSFCIISKFPYFTALKDCLSCLSVQLRTCCLSDMEERVREFATRLSLVPVPPPGQLQLMFSLPPLTIVLPPQEDADHPVIDLALHLPFLCFRPQQLLQLISCLLQEQRLVLLSANWAKLTLVAESLMVLLQPFTWQQPYVPVLSRGMLDFLMAPTAFLMGCHVSHFEEVVSETDGLILVNIDKGTVYASSWDPVDLPDVPSDAADCFTERCQSLQVHLDLDECHQMSSCDIDEQRTWRRTWQHNLNLQIQRVALELMVNLFRDVSSHLNYEHRVFNSQEFLKTREPAELPFYKTVLETHTFHSFLRDRLNRKMDSYARLELISCCEMWNIKPEVPYRPTMQEIQTRRKSSTTGRTPGTMMSEPALNAPPEPVKTFKLPDFPESLSFHSIQGFYGQLIQQLDKAISSVQNEDDALLARFSAFLVFPLPLRKHFCFDGHLFFCRFYYLRGFISALYSRRLDALSDFQNLYKTDALVFPAQLVSWLVDTLPQDERRRAEQRPELQSLILRVKTENEKPPVQQDNQIKTFVLPMQKMSPHQFVSCIQESGIVKDVGTIKRLFKVLADGQPAQVDPLMFRDFYTVWKEIEAGSQDINLPSNVIERLDSNECVYKLSSCVKTSIGVGSIAMTQKRLFLLTEGRPGYLEITKFRDIVDVKKASAPFLLVRIPSLRIRTSKRPEVFEANLKTETELWSLMVKEMWIGRKMADRQKDPQYLTQALTNVLLMETVVRCLQSQKSIVAAAQLTNFDRLKREVSMTEHETTSETLKHRINPSQDLYEPQTVHVLLYTPGQLNCGDSQGDMHPKLWVALSGGRVVVYDATSWSMLQGSIQVGRSQLNCMVGLGCEQVWIGSQDSVIYIIDARSMSCNKQLTEHRHEVTALAADARHHAYSCSGDGTILQWDAASLKVRKQFHLKPSRWLSLQMHDDALWCCCGDSIVELREDGEPQRILTLPDDLQSVNNVFSCFVVLPQGQVWAGCAKSGDLCFWQINSLLHSSMRILIPGASEVTCMIRVKEQIWIGCDEQSRDGGLCDDRVKSRVLVVDPRSHTVAKELLAHSDAIQALCSIEDRYVLSGSACRDGKIAIWKVE